MIASTLLLPPLLPIIPLILPRPIPRLLLAIFKLIGRVGITTRIEIIEKVILIVLFRLFIPEVRPFEFDLDNIGNVVGLLVEFGVGGDCLYLAALLVAPGLDLGEGYGFFVVVGALVEAFYYLFVLEDQLDFVIKEM